MHRIIGTGQFGLVRIVRHMKTNEVYALKVGAVDEEKLLIESSGTANGLSRGLQGGCRPRP